MLVSTARRVAPAIVLSLGLASTGCWIPSPDVSNPGVATVVDFEPGVTTAAEVRRALGDPTEFERPDVWVYKWFKGSGALLFGAGYGVGVIPLPSHEFRALFEFDQDGRLLRYQYDRSGEGVTPDRIRQMLTARIPATTQRKCPAPGECYEAVATNTTSTFDEANRHLWPTLKKTQLGLPCGCSRPMGAADDVWVLPSGHFAAVYDHMFLGQVIDSAPIHQLWNKDRLRQVDSCAADGDRLVTLHRDGTLILWSFADRGSIRSMPAPVPKADQVLWPEAGGPPLLLGAGGQVSTLDRETLEPVATWSIDGDAPSGAWRDPTDPDLLLVGTRSGGLIKLSWPSLEFLGDAQAADRRTWRSSPAPFRWQVVAVPQPWCVTVADSGARERVIRFVPHGLSAGEAPTTVGLRAESFQYLFLDDHRLLLSDHGLATVWDLDAMLPGEGTLEVGMLDPTAPSPRAVFLLPYGTMGVQVTMSDGP